MKHLNLWGLLILLSLLLLFNNAKAQKVVEKSGHQPHWTNWSRGKDFKSLKKGRAKKIKLNRQDDVYLFVANARERAYYEKGGQEWGYTLDDARRSTSLNASFEVASILKNHVDAVVANSTRIPSGARERIFERTERMKTAANFSGFTRVAQYWERVQDKDSELEYYDVKFLYTFSKKTLTDLLDRVSAQLEIPSEDSNDILNQVLTAAEEVPDADLGDF